MLSIVNSCNLIGIDGFIVNVEVDITRGMPCFNIVGLASIEIKEAKKASPRYKEIVEVTGGRLVPEWLDADIENLRGTVKNLPSREMIDVPVNEMLIVELYSK